MRKIFITAAFALMVAGLFSTNEAMALGEIPCDQQASTLARQIVDAQTDRYASRYVVQQVSVLRTNTGGNANTFDTVYQFRGWMPSNNDAYTMFITIRYSEYPECYLNSVEVQGAG